MKVSKVVLIVVALHVLVIGGIFIFEGCSRAKAPAPDMAANETPAGDQAVANASALPAPQPVEATAQNNLAPVPPAAATAPVTATPQPAARTYVVKKGDSLWKIAKTEGISIGDLARANNLTQTSVLKIGRKLQIPATAKAEEGGTAAVSADAGGQMYTVKSGDSLWKIAHGQNVTVAALKQANNLTSDSLKVGQKLHLPTGTTSASAAAAAPVTTGGPATTAGAGTAASVYSDWHEPGTAMENGQTVHYVDIGESPALIARKYGVKVDDLIRANNITDSRRIIVGQRLIIPAGQTSAPSAPATPAVAAPMIAAPQAAAGN